MSEVEQLAEEYVRVNCDDSLYSFRGQELKQAYIAAAEPREKRIADLQNNVAILTNENRILKQGKTNVFAELNDETAESNAMLMDKVADLEQENAELKAQIEKMRNFQNCDYQLHITDCPIFKIGGHISCKKCPHWTLQEMKEK